MSSTQRAKVLLLIPHLGGGGAERVISILARCVSPEKYEVHLGLVTQSAPEMQNVPELSSVYALEHAEFVTAHGKSCGWFGWCARQ